MNIYHRLAVFLKYLLLFLILCFSETVVRAQQDTIISTISNKSGNQTTGYGRDFWFAIPQNYDSSGNNGKYFNVYVGSFRNTIVNVQVNGKPLIKRSVLAGQVITLISPNDIPLNKEVTSSGIIERDKTIHIWSDDADLSVYFLSRVPYSTDGMYVIPSAGWGKEYIVAAFPSLFEGVGGGYIFDYPSEFVIVADEDSTLISIIPSCDLRKNGFPDSIDHPRGIPFYEMLNRGECIQYKAVRAQGSDSFDVTGTIVKSNRGIGVIGATQLANIPFDYPYADYLLEMIPPIRTWARTYFSAPFAGRVRAADAFLIVAMSNNQSIKRNGQIIATLNLYDHIFIFDTSGDAYQWTSDSSFMLAQYICSSEYPDRGGNFGIGDPAMVVINSSEQFVNKILFQTPTIATGGGFVNYVNLILPIVHESNTTFDGHALDNIPGVSSIKRIPLQKTGWEVIRFGYPNSKLGGAHVILSDTGVGVYLYGFGSYDSYAWAGNIGVTTPNSVDSIPPVGTVNGTGFSTSVHLKDNRQRDTRLSEIQIDSTNNMLFIRDSSFIPGSGRDSSFYRVSVIDSSKPGYALVSSYDLAGNRTQVESKFYSRKIASFMLSDFDFGCIAVGDSKTTNATTADNLSELAVTIDSISVDDKLHFSFLGIPSLPVVLKQNGLESFKFKYTPTAAKHDTTFVHFHSLEAGTKTSKLIGCGLQPASVNFGDYASSLSKESSEYALLSSRLDKGEQLAILPPIPNPASRNNSQVRFVFGTSESSLLKLSLYDLLGKEIAVIFDDNFPAGIYESRYILPGNIPAGNYIYRLSSSWAVKSGKIAIFH